MIATEQTFPSGTINFGPWCVGFSTTQRQREWETQLNKAPVVSNLTNSFL